ncbi:MAG TPA: oligosaccharide flippase family protein [Chitinophagales bacterium]|nr:oligosaccharide flippase family protein [Chitinophagales bacterium]
MKKVIKHIRQLSFYDTLRHGSVYLLSLALTQVITVLSIPVFTKLLAPDDFGVYEVYNNTIRFLSVLISLNLYAGFYRYYFEQKLNKQPLMQFLLRMSFFSFIIGVVLLLVFKNILLKTVNLPGDVFIWIPIGIFSTIILNFFVTYNNAQQLSIRTGVWQLIMQFLRVGASILFIWYFSKNYLGRIAGEYTAMLLVSVLLLLLYFRKYIGFSEVLPNKLEIIKYATAFIPIGLSSYIISYIDLVLINNIQGNAASGVYSYAYKFAVIYSGFSQSFVTANRPTLFNLLKENKNEEVVEQIRSMFKLITVLASIFIFFGGDAGCILSFKPEFNEALHLLPILIMGYVLSDIAEIYNFFLYYSKKVKLFYISFLTTAIVNFILNLLLIPKYGYQVAAYTTLASYTVLFSATYLVCKFYTDLSVPRWTVLTDYIVILFAVLGAGQLLAYFISNIWILIAVKMLLFVLLVFTLFFKQLKTALATIKSN